MVLALLSGCVLEILDFFRRALCGVLDDEANQVASEIREWLKHRIQGRGQEVGTLPYESLAGREQIIDYLMRMKGFLDDKKARVLGIYGMGGIGKTTLLRIFNDKVVGKHARGRFDHIILSQCPRLWTSRRLREISQNK